MKHILTLTFILFVVLSQAQVRIISYNVENLFDTQNDSLTQDEDFLPDGKYHWTYSRYQRKLENISRVVANIGKWDTPTIVGLCEVENEQCIKDLLNIGGLRKYGYKYLHQDSPDERGIDCALLYDPKQFHIIDNCFIPIPMPQEERPTRDIVYAKGVIKLTGRGHHLNTDTLHILLCHLPSQLGGTEQTAHKRLIAYRILQHTIDSIAHADFMAKILVMGDMNSTPAEHLRGMHNLMIQTEKEGKGTHKWKGVWSCLDQFYVSQSLIDRAKANIYSDYWLLEEDKAFGGDIPMRCFVGLRWQAGYSDHLPIYLDLF